MNFFTTFIICYSCISLLMDRLLQHREGSQQFVRFNLSFSSDEHSLKTDQIMTKISALIVFLKLFKHDTEISVQCWIEHTKFGGQAWGQIIGMQHPVCRITTSLFNITAVVFSTLPGSALKLPKKSKNGLYTIRFFRFDPMHIETWNEHI